MTTTSGWPEDWCFHHEERHGPTAWSDGCQSVDDIMFDRQHELFQQAWQQAEREDRRHRRRRRRRRIKRWTVCWWKHRTRKVGDGAYLSRSCWACADPS